MTATILPFPTSRTFQVVRVIRAQDEGWLVIADEHAWDHRSLEHAIAEAVELARDFGVKVLVTP